MMHQPVEINPEILVSRSSEPREPILIVDDDHLSLMLLKITLERNGWEVIAVENGLKALEVMSKVKPAVIICDQRMPDLTGIQVLNKAIELCPDAIRILLAGETDLSTAIQAINIGQVSQFILKPWPEAQLTQIVQSSVEKYRLIHENQKLQYLILAQHQTLAKNHEILKSEMLLGSRIHKILLVGKPPPNVPGFSIASASLPSKEIDGDFYDFYQSLPDVLDIALGDVMGKGIPAALVATAVKSQLMHFAMPFVQPEKFSKNLFWQDLLSPDQILSSVHAAIVPKLINLEYFVSILYGRFNLSKKSFQYIDCGIAKPIHYQSITKKALLLKGDNYPLGIVEEEQYHCYETFYGKDDIFVFYSDGITEAKSTDNQLFGENRLIQIVEKHAHLEANQLLDLIKSTLISFAQSDTFDDDLTLVIIKIIDVICKEKANNEAKFSADFSQLEAIRSFVECICTKSQKNSEIISSQLKLAVNEIFCNIVKHGYKGQPKGEVVIRGEFDDQGVTIDLADQGLAFSPAQVEEPSLHGDRTEGFGWYILRQIADEITYIPKKTDQGWNHIRIFKKYSVGEMQMQIDHTIHHDILIITPKIASIDANNNMLFKQSLLEIIQMSNCRKVILELMHLEFIDSSGLGSFLSVLRRLHTQGGELKLSCMNKPVRLMFELVSMHKIFEIFNTTEDASQSFQ